MYTELLLIDVISNDSYFHCFAYFYFSKLSVMGFVRRKKNHEWKKKKSHAFNNLNL